MNVTPVFVNGFFSEFGFAYFYVYLLQTVHELRTFFTALER